MMNSKETTILELINLLKIVEPALKKECKVVMLVDSSSSKKSSKNKKKRKSTKAQGGVAKKKASRQPQKVLTSIVARMAIRRETTRPIWSL